MLLIMCYYDDPKKYLMKVLTSDNSLSPKLSYCGTKIRVQFT